MPKQNQKMSFARLTSTQLEIDLVMFHMRYLIRQWGEIRGTRSILSVES